MSDLTIEETPYTPLVKITDASRTIEIAGKSLPEDARKFFLPVLKWIEDSAKQGGITVTFHLTYFNSSTSKQLLRMFYLLEDVSENGTTATINWKYDQNDSMMLERGEELSQMIELPFTLIQI